MIKRYAINGLNFNNSIVDYLSYSKLLATLCVLWLFVYKLTYPLLLYKTCFKNFYYTTGNPGILINCSITQYCNINTLLSGDEVGINAVIFILFTHHNFRLYLEWSRDATQGYFAECRMQNGIVLNMQMKWENNLALFVNPLRTIPTLHSAFCKIPLPKMSSFVDLHFGGFLFSVLTLPGPHATPLPPMSAPTYSDLLRLIVTGIQR